MKARHLLAAAALVLLAGSAFAQGTSLGWGQPNRRPSSATSPSVPRIQALIVGGVNPADSSGVPLQFTSGGSLITSEVSPLSEQNLTFPNIISNAGMSIGGSDSSAVLDTHRMRLGTLLIKAFPGTGNAGGGANDTSVTYRVAFQIRTHLNGSSDSSSTFAFSQYSKTDMGGSAASAQTDSSVSGHILNAFGIAGVAATPTNNQAWSGEFTVVIDSHHFARASSVAIATAQFYYPSGIALPLSSVFGRDIFSPYTSVRVRVEIISRGAASAATATLGLNVSLVGTPL